jgi:hypothetical protein
MDNAEQSTSRGALFICGLGWICDLAGNFCRHGAGVLRRAGVLRGAADMCLAPRARGGLTLCSPWLEYAECPVCRQWEVIIPEYRSPEPGRTEYRGVRTGHKHPGVSENLARIRRFAGSADTHEPTHATE